jgi:hypothetical protein
MVCFNYFSCQGESAFDEKSVTEVEALWLIERLKLGRGKYKEIVLYLSDMIIKNCKF